MKQDYSVIVLRRKDVTEDGIKIKPTDIQLPQKECVTGKELAFELKKAPASEPNAFFYENELYMVNSRDGNKFDCIAVILSEW